MTPLKEAPGFSDTDKNVAFKPGKLPRADRFAHILLLRQGNSLEPWEQFSFLIAHQ